MMATKANDNCIADRSASEDDFSVKPAELEKTHDVDGLATENSALSPELTTKDSDLETSSVSDKHGLEHSPKLSTEGRKNDTSVKEGEIVEEPLEVPEEVQLAEAAHGDKPGPEPDSDTKATDEEQGDEERAGIEVNRETDAKDGQVKAAIINSQSVTTNGGNDLFALEGFVHGKPAAETGTKTAEASPAPTEVEHLRSTQETTESEDDVAVTDSKETVAHVSQPGRSVPPHLRKEPHVPVARDPDHGVLPRAAPLPARYSDFLRPPRQHFVPGARYNNRHQFNGDNREELARMSAENMKLRHELEVERKKSLEMQKTIELEKEKIMDDALSVMTIELLNKQAKLLAHQYKVDAKERDLEFRQTRIDQIEVYLTEGQRQVYRYQQGKLDGPTMDDVDREHDRRQAELQAQKKLADVEARLSQQLQALQLREDALQMREEQYKAIIHSSFEAKIRDKAQPDMAAELEEVADIEYSRGFKAGKLAGRVESEEDASRKGFLDGYAASQRAQIALSKLRQGVIAPNSAELNFLFDAAHPHHLFNLGARVGGKESAVSVVKTQAQVVQKETEIVVEEKVAVNQVKVEEPIRKAQPPPRPTFASELRGAQNMHNGHFVLANGSGPSSPAPTKTNGVNTRDVKGGNIDEGRPVIKYDSAEEVSLIDLD